MHRLRSNRLGKARPAGWLAAVTGLAALAVSWAPLRLLAGMSLDRYIVDAHPFRVWAAAVLLSALAKSGESTGSFRYL